MEKANELKQWFDDHHEEIISLFESHKSNFNRLPDSTEEEALKLFKEFVTQLPGGYSKLLSNIEDASIEIAGHILLAIDWFYQKLPQELFNEEFVRKLDTGNVETIVFLFQQLFETIKSEDPERFQNSNFLHFTPLIKNLNGPILKQVAKIILCLHLKIEDTALTSTEYLLVLILRRLQPSSLRHEIIQHEGVKFKAQNAAKKGIDKRWEKTRQIKEFAYQLRQKKSYKNDSQASKSLTVEICEFAQQIGEPFTDQFAAQARIYNWYREDPMNKK